MTIGFDKDGFSLALARDEADLRDAQRLRYDVFVQELGAGGAEVDHAMRRDRDPFDAHSDHLILRDSATGAAVGVYRLLRADQARAAGGFYTEAEYDLAPLKASGRTLLELGRSCVRADHRGGAAMFHLWTGLSQYVEAHGAEVLFGVASFKGTDPQTIAEQLSLLHHAYRAPEDLRPKSRSAQRMNLIDTDQLDRRRSMVNMPPLVKAYLRLGGLVGEGAFVDHAFNCIDVCMVMDTKGLNARYARYYQMAAAP